MENESKKVSIISIVIILVGVLACGFGLYMLLGGKSDKSLFISTLEKMPGDYDALSNLSPKMLSQKIIDNDSNLKLSATLNSKKVETNESFALESLISKKGSVYLKVSNEIDKTFVESLLKDKSSYISFDGSNNVYEKKLDEEELPISNENFEKVLTFISKYQNLFDSALKYTSEEIKNFVNDKELKTEDATISLGGKDTKTKKISLSVSERDVLTIVKNLYNKISNDKDFKDLLDLLNSFSNSGISGNFDIKTILDNYNMMLENADSSKEVLVFSVYRKGNEAVSERVSIKFEGTSVDLIADTYKDSDGNDTFEFRVASAGFTALKFVVTKIDSNKTVVNANYLSFINIRMDVESYDDRYNIILEPSSSFGDSSELGTISLGLKEVKKNENYEFNFSSNINGSDIKLNGNIISTKDEPSMDISNSVDYEQMSDEEKEKISSMLERIIPFDSFNSIFGSDSDFENDDSSSDFDFDFDFDIENDDSDFDFSSDLDSNDEI